MEGKPGDDVILPSGGPPMSVEEVRETPAASVGMGNKGDLLRATLPLAVLELAEAEPSDEEEDDEDEHEEDDEDEGDEEEDEPKKKKK